MSTYSTDPRICPSITCNVQCVQDSGENVSVSSYNTKYDTLDMAKVKTKPAYITCVVGPFKTEGSEQWTLSFKHILAKITFITWQNLFYALLILN